jgi:hypothetical protein
MDLKEKFEQGPVADELRIETISMASAWLPWLR